MQRGWLLLLLLLLLSLEANDDPTNRRAAVVAARLFHPAFSVVNSSPFSLSLSLSLSPRRPVCVSLL